MLVDRMSNFPNEAHPSTPPAQVSPSFVLILKDSGRGGKDLCRCDSEWACRNKLNEIIPTLSEDQIVLLVQETAPSIKILGTYMRPPNLSNFPGTRRH